MKSVIYTRVSSQEQSTSRQINDLRKVEGFEAVKVFSEKVSGFSKKMEERAQLQAMLKYVAESEVEAIMVHEISRLGRNTHETLTLLKKLEEQRVRLYIHNLGITLNAGNPADDIFSKLIVTIVSDLARLESEQLSTRIKSGIVERKRKGLHTGRLVGTVESREKFLSKHKDIQKYLGQGMSYSEIKRLCRCGMSTISKVKEQLSE
ncbi:DNA invertase Pin-like site-specific DNA recombinase [Pontibacter aydingkolensis]|uniref:Recombinase family protein n=1 Tax=Pontibacter aydingkolensis TaxID=1911536 RepID=A0ABS7CZ46_9BACT|nr:recombinase family protein [Pontibacter aydingkolensis]MBW7469131.1 recombinase family protein [Pontibacter aydingkolensis]